MNPLNFLAVIFRYRPRAVPCAFALVVFLFAVPSPAAPFLFEGTFVHDNDVAFITFNLLSAGTVTLQTFGFGGGTSATGPVILAGGFESALQVYDALTGNAAAGTILPGPNPTCAPRTPDPNRLNFCQDAYGQLSLGAGSYLLALTQDPNLANGNLSDGFFYVDTIPDPNFNNGFVGKFDLPGNGHWAIEIIGADAASSAAVPEPSSFLLMAATLAGLGLGAKKLRNI